MDDDPTPLHSSRPACSPADRTAGGPDSDESLLDICVTATESGPVMTLSGEADVTTLARLEAALRAQLATGARILMVDLSGLRFADSATIGALVRAARMLKDQGGRLDLLNPKPGLARMLSLLGVDEVLTVRGGRAGPGPGRPRPAPWPDDRQPW